MRGKAVKIAGQPSKRRITPAYAGKRATAFAVKKVTDGSPPPMRGKAIDLLSGVDKTGDHPRLCGEKFSARIFKYLSIGSPPPMRGKVRMHEGKLAMDRITPAYAGKSRQQECYT